MALAAGLFGCVDVAAVAFTVKFREARLAPRANVDVVGAFEAVLGGAFLADAEAKRMADGTLATRCSSESNKYDKQREGS